jgi:nitrite reductase/ring-hydroxylating ferredoxin subunit
MFTSSLELIRHATALSICSLNAAVIWAFEKVVGYAAMNTGNENWIKVAASVAEIPFASNDIAEVEVAGKRFCIGRYKDDLFAFAAKCPHASGRLQDGFIDGLGNVVCPLHRYKFCLKNGRNVSGEGYYLKHWPVEMRHDGVYVALEKKVWL